MALLIRGIVVMRSIAVLALLLTLRAAADAQIPHVASAHRTIATANPAVQALFDRGLVMLYAFNIGEARQAFRAAEAVDPRAVMPFFGEALAETIDINRPTTPAGEQRAAAALARGHDAAAGAPSDERELFAAAALRFDARRPEKERFAQFFHALQTYADTHPTDGLGTTLAAFAGWNATDALRGSGDVLTADALTISADLERSLKADSNDVGAHHLRIHFWEQALEPDLALADANYFAALTYDLGESHLQHMAGHIYDRLGQYADMVAVNKSACANDVAYFARGHGEGQQYMQTYHAHDTDFVLYGLTTLGFNADAKAFALRESLHSRELVALRSGDNRAVLQLLGDAVTPLRVMAEARLGDVEQARKDLAGLTSTGSADADDDVAAATLARAAHDSTASIAAYRKAGAAAGSELGDPKVHWWAPVGEGLGASLLEAHLPADAERVFRAELVRYPNDPRLEFGLAQAQVAQGEDDTLARSAYVAGWNGDKPLSLADLG